MFSFFRKEKPGDLMSYLKEGQPETAKGPAYTLAHAGNESLMGGIEVEEAAGGLAPEIEEAAVLYANGKAGEAASLLNRFLLDHPNDRDPLPWHMLFDLYEASNQPGPFEDAAVEFAVKFERSPPTWSPRNQVREAPQPVPLLSFGEKTGADPARMQRFFREMDVAPYIRIDVSKAPAPDDDVARVMNQAIDTSLQRGKPVELIGAPGFAVRLSSARQGDRLTEAGWRVWLSTLQLMNKEADFEDVAVEYAITFELSPPSFKAPLPLPKRGGDKEEEAVSGGSRHVFHLQGVLGQGCEATLAELIHFAEERKSVIVNLSGLLRIDFTAVGTLLDTIMNLAQGGRRVDFIEGNEMVNTLLKIVGAGTFAGIHSRTRV